ncbi:MAG: hypothetical protein F6K14_16095 [Symploca sp. SIO2C1]|nr:hypothetical protein [Symploca sp. SIO2C1]
MSDWKWFLRVAFLGFVGTVVLSQVLSRTLEQDKSDRSLVLAITPKEVQAQADLLEPLESSIIPEDISVPLFPSVPSTTENIPAPETPLPSLPLITPKEIPTPEAALPTLPPIPQLETLTRMNKKKGGERSKQTWRHGDTETRRHGDAETRRHGDTETRRIPRISFTPPKENPQPTVSQETRQEAEPTPNPSKEGNRRQEGRGFGLFVPFIEGGALPVGRSEETQGKREEKKTSITVATKTLEHSSSTSNTPDETPQQQVTETSVNILEGTSQLSVTEPSVNTLEEISQASVTEPPINTSEEATSQEQPSGANQEVLSASLDEEQSLDQYSALFASPISLGMVAIGVAEGNYRLFIEDGNLYVEQTSLYFGHTDPGNLSWGDVVTNYGPCSDQGRSGGNIALAEELCLQRSLSQLPTNIADLQAVGIDPSADIEALLNTADLYNQASLIHSRRFPEALAWARRAGHNGVEAIAWARTASFYLNENQEIDLQEGKNKASGLLGICARENQPITEWQCVYRDQLRRTKAIASVLDTYRQLSQAEEVGG